MKVAGAAHTSYTVSDLERSKRFYCGLLGCEVLWEREVVESYFRAIVGFPDCVVKAAQLRIPGSDHVLELFEYAHPRGGPAVPPVNRPGSSHIAFLVDDIHAACEELGERGVVVRSDPVEVDYGANEGAWGVYIEDPDGIPMELFQLPPR